MQTILYVYPECCNHQPISFCLEKARLLAGFIRKHLEHA
jgi:hypothetical protein